VTTPRRAAPRATGAQPQRSASSPPGRGGPSSAQGRRTSLRPAACQFPRRSLPCRTDPTATGDRGGGRYFINRPPLAPGFRSITRTRPRRPDALAAPPPSAASTCSVDGEEAPSLFLGRQCSVIRFRHGFLEFSVTEVAGGCAFRLAYYGVRRPSDVRYPQDPHARHLAARRRDGVHSVDTTKTPHPCQAGTRRELFLAGKQGGGDLDGGGMVARLPTRRPGGGRYFIYRPGWTVFQLPSTPEPLPNVRSDMGGRDRLGSGSEALSVPPLSSRTDLLCLPPSPSMKHCQSASDIRRKHHAGTGSRTAPPVTSFASTPCAGRWRQARPSPRARRRAVPSSHASS